MCSLQKSHEQNLRYQLHFLPWQASSTDPCSENNIKPCWFSTFFAVWEKCVERKHDKQWAAWSRSKRSHLKKLNRRSANLGSSRSDFLKPKWRPVLHAPLRTVRKNNFFATSNQVLVAAKQLPESRNSSMFHLQSPPLYYQLLQWWCPHWQRHPWIVCACVPPETLTCKNVTCAEEHPPWASEPIVSNVLVSRGLEPQHFAGSPSSFHIAPRCGISRKFLSGK